MVFLCPRYRSDSPVNGLRFPFVMWPRCLDRCLLLELNWLYQCCSFHNSKILVDLGHATKPFGYPPCVTPRIDESDQRLPH
jgi:hypothetical protein